ncbi:hypothetical protein HPB50_002031 [Hyalomma asiaticum]|uniref:Uncharacterized protein n=1 Tax=Hyalomma asiaticum TaxID=266040 RepID=A0ACB7T5A2_HYAAI|nr:hypothetical protein HPB50_002031 [Hyalomma asiaticum]
MHWWYSRSPRGVPHSSPAASSVSRMARLLVNGCATALAGYVPRCTTLVTTAAETTPARALRAANKRVIASPLRRVPHTCSPVGLRLLKWSVTYGVSWAVLSA